MSYVSDHAHNTSSSQMSSGTCYGIVPYVDSANTGSVAGVVGTCNRSKSQRGDCKSAYIPSTHFTYFFLLLPLSVSSQEPGEMSGQPYWEHSSCLMTTDRQWNTWVGLLF